MVFWWVMEWYWFSHCYNYYGDLQWRLLTLNRIIKLSYPYYKCYVNFKTCTLVSAPGWLYHITIVPNVGNSSPKSSAMYVGNGLQKPFPVFWGMVSIGYITFLLAILTICEKDWCLPCTWMKPTCWFSSKPCLIIGWYLIKFLLGSGKSWIYIPAKYGGFLWMFPQKSSLGYVRWNHLRNVEIGFWMMILLDFVRGICWEISRDCIFRRCHTLMTNYYDRSIDHLQTNR